MENFLKAIPAAASSPYALAAYFICAVVFIIAGARLRRIKTIMEQIKHVPAKDRKEAIEIATETRLPSSISAEQWIRLNRVRWTFLIIATIILAVTTIVVIALTHTKTVDDTGIKKEVVKTGEEIKEDIKGSEANIVNVVQDTAIANLETMFPLTVRIDRDVDSTIMQLNGSPRQQIISYDRNGAPMKLYWGDRFHYFVFSSDGSALQEGAEIFLEISNSTETTRLPLRIDRYSESELRIPGSTPEPFDAYLINPARLRGLEFKITVYSADRERGREEFRKALMATSLADRARTIYKSVRGNDVRLRSEPIESGRILRSLREDTYVKVLQTQEQWSQIRLPEGREGWIKTDSLKLIQ